MTAKRITFWSAVATGGTYMGAPPRAYGRTEQELILNMTRPKGYGVMNYSEIKEHVIEYEDEFDLMMKAMQFGW